MLSEREAAEADGKPLALQLQPSRAALDTAVAVDPTIYRLYEVVLVYGPTIKEQW